MDYENMDKEMLIKILRKKDDMLKRLCLELLGKEFNLSKTNDKNLVVCFVDIDRLKIKNEMSISDLIQKADAEMYKKKLKKKEDFDDMCIINIHS